MTVYATVDELKERIQIESALTAAQEAMLLAILTGVSKNIDKICRRERDGFVAASVASARYFRGAGESFLRINDCFTVTNVAVRESLTATEYTDWTTPTTPMAGDGDWIPARGSANFPVFGCTPYNLLLVDPNSQYAYFLDTGAIPGVEVTARWGPYESIEPDIREATIMQSARLYKRFQASGSTSVGSVDFEKIAYQRTLDAAVKQILVDGCHILPLYAEH